MTEQCKRLVKRECERYKQAYKIMELAKILNENENVMLVVSGKDLKEFANTIAHRFVSYMEIEPVSEPDNEKLYTASEVGEMLHVTSTTLYRWDKANYLKPTRIGGKRFYRGEDIKKLSNTK